MPRIPRRILEKDYLVLKQCRHGTFAYNKFDTFIGRSLDIYGEWCDSEISLLSKLVGPGSIVLDVGANIGCHTVPLASRVAPKGIVIAFEPQRLVFQLLCANAALNCLGNVVCYPHAVGAATGVAVIPAKAPRQSFNFGGVALKNDGPGERVAVTTIDSLGLSACHLIKIDVEGMEAAVLAGAKNTIQAFHPVLFVENNREDGAAAVIDAVLGLGSYRAWWHIQRYFSPGNFFGNNDDVFSNFAPEANMICLHESLGLAPIGLPEVIGHHDTWRMALDREPGVLAASSDVKLRKT